MKQYIQRTMEKAILKLQRIKTGLSGLLRQWNSEDDHVMVRLEEQFFSEADIACR